MGPQAGGTDFPAEEPARSGSPRVGGFVCIAPAGPGGVDVEGVGATTAEDCEATPPGGPVEQDDEQIIMKFPDGTCRTRHSVEAPGASPLDVAMVSSRGSSCTASPAGSGATTPEMPSPPNGQPADLCSDDDLEELPAQWIAAARSPSESSAELRSCPASDAEEEDGDETEENDVLEEDPVESEELEEQPSHQSVQDVGETTEEEEDGAPLVADLQKGRLIRQLQVQQRPRDRRRLRTTARRTRTTLQPVSAAQHRQAHGRGRGQAPRPEGNFHTSYHRGGVRRQLAHIRDLRTDWPRMVRELEVGDIRIPCSMLAEFLRRLFRSNVFGGDCPGNITEDEYTMLNDEVLPHAVHACYIRDDYPGAWAEDVVVFFESCIVYLVLLVQTARPHFCALSDRLKFVWGHRTPFFQKYGRGDEETMDQSDVMSETYVDLIHADLAKPFIQKHRGLLVFRDFLRKVGTAPDSIRFLRQAESLVSFIAEMHPRYVVEYMPNGQYVECIRDIIHIVATRFLNIDELVAKPGGGGGAGAVDKAVVAGLVHACNRILKAGVDNNIFYRREQTRFRLLVAPRLLKCQRLELRLMGLNTIKDMTHRIVQDNPFGSGSRYCREGYQDDEENDESPEDMDVSEFVCWLREQQVLEYIFGPNMHMEVVNRTGSLISFLLEYDQFTERDLDIIWAPISSDQHRSVVQGLFRLLGEVSRGFRRVHFTAMLDKLSVRFLWPPAAASSLLPSAASTPARSSSGAGSASPVPSARNPSSKADRTAGDRASLSGLAAASGPWKGPRAFDVDALTFLDRLFDAMVYRVKQNSGILDEVPFQAYEILWSLLQADIDEAIVQDLFQLLSTYLEVGPRNSADRQMLVESCMENLRRHHSVPYSLKLLTTLFELYPRFTFDGWPREKYLRELYDVRHLPDLFLDDLTHFVDSTRGAKDAAESSANPYLGGRPPSPSAMSTGGSERPMCPHPQQIRAELVTRLEFLRTVVNARHPPFITRTQQADALWDCLIANPIGPEEREEAFRHLCRVQNEEFMTHFFRKRFPELDGHLMSPAGFDYFRECYIAENLKYKRMIRREAHSPSSQEGPVYAIDVVDDLLGLEMLWNIVLHCVAEEVGTSALAYLVGINVQNNNWDSEERNICDSRHRREMLIDTCVGHLLASAKALSIVNDCQDSVEADLEDGDEGGRLAPRRYKPPSLILQDPKLEARKFGRCMKILTFLIETFRSRYPRTEAKYAGRPHGSTVTAEVMTLRVKVYERPDLVDVEVEDTDTIQDIRRKIEKSLDAAHGVRVFANGKELDQSVDSKTLKEYRFSDRQVLQVMMRQAGHGGAAPHPDRVPAAKGPNVECENMIVASDLPASLLSEPRYFERFFRILYRLDEEYASQIWDLLMMLPTNSGLLRSLQDLRPPVRWEVLLDSRSPFTLRYSLQIVQYLLQTCLAKKPALDADAGHWTSLFLMSGGLHRLFAILLSDADFVRGSFGGNAQPAHAKHEGPGDNAKVRGASHAGKACWALLLKVINLALYAAEVESMALSQDMLENLPVTSRLMSMLSGCVQAASEEADVQDEEIVSHGLKLLLDWSNRLPQGLTKICQLGARGLLFDVLVGCRSASLRHGAAQHIYEFCGQSLQRMDESCGEKAEHFDFIVRLLFELLSDVSDRIDSCKEFFELLVQLLRPVERNRPEFEMMVTGVVPQLINAIKSLPVREQSDSGGEDSVLCGYLRLLDVILAPRCDLKRAAVEEHDMINVLFNHCLFYVPSLDNVHNESRPPKCKTPNSRTAAFRLLYQLVGEPRSFVKFADLAISQLEGAGAQLQHVWNYCPRLTQKASCGRVGLMNLGTTCYINSLVQQFYMNTAFREGLLAAPLKDVGPKEDDLLYQMQVMFASLQESEKKAFDTTPFCQAYKDYDGRSLNVNVQMDVDEFFNLLFDRLENSASGTAQEKLFKEQYGGTLVQQIKSRECEHVSEREESFFAIQCEVKNKKDVSESMQLYIEAETLDGDNKYHCASCNKKVDAVKRACIKRLPANLILHLKRFDFDMEAMRRIKINDRFEFPSTINFEPYTLDYLTRKETGALNGAETQLDPAYEYELVGVLVHTGTADSGHYYSFIRERSSRPDPWWYQFNDSNVDFFDPATIPQHCFGGAESAPRWDPAGQRRHYPKPYSAYMLFYQRRDCLSQPESHRAEKCSIPRDIYKSIWEDNTAFLRYKDLFDTEYFRFLWSVLQPAEKAAREGSPELADAVRERIADVTMNFFLNVMARSKNRSGIADWVGYTIHVFESRPKSLAAWVDRLTRDPNPLRQLLLWCPCLDVRDATMDLVSSMLRRLVVQDVQLYNAAMQRLVEEVSRGSRAASQDGDPPIKPGSTMLNFVNMCLEMNVRHGAAQEAAGGAERCVEAPASGHHANGQQAAEGRAGAASPGRAGVRSATSEARTNQAAELGDRPAAIPPRDATMADSSSKIHADRITLGNSDEPADEIRIAEEPEADDNPVEILTANDDVAEPPPATIRLSPGDDGRFR